MAEEQVIIDDVQFDSLLGMLQSTDQENAVVALHCLENCDFKASLGRILYLYKHSKADDKLWGEHAPQLSKKLTAMGLVIGEDITFENAFKILSQNKATKESFEFMFSKLGNVFRDEIAQWGYGWIKTIDIKITLDEDAFRQSGEGQ